MKPLVLVAKHRMVRDDRWKLLYVPTRAGVRWMLFDTQADPGEERDVAAEHPDVVNRLRTVLLGWMERDSKMQVRDGFLVPREVGGGSESADEKGLVRLE
jgi:hypothetical protein